MATYEVIDIPSAVEEVDEAPLELQAASYEALDADILLKIRSVGETSEGIWQQLLQMGENVKQREGKKGKGISYSSSASYLGVPTSQSENMMIPIQQFLERVIVMLGTDIDKNVAFMIVNLVADDDLQITERNFAAFLTCFGPFSKFLSNVAQVCAQPWFHSYTTTEAAERFLHSSSVGSFMIRFSSAGLGSFVLSIKKSNGEVSHSRIESNSPAMGIRMNTVEGVKVYPDIMCLVADLPRECTPYIGDLSDCPYFHAMLSTEACERILRQSIATSFLFRFSSQPGFITLSRKSVNDQITHHRFLLTPSDWIEDPASHQSWPTLHALVDAAKWENPISHRRGILRQLGLAMGN